MSDKNVIDFVSLREQIESAIEPLSHKEFNYDACKHKHKEVDKRARTLTCKKCGVALDPITVLSEIATEFSGWKAKQMSDRLAALEALERKLRDKLKENLMTPEERAMTALEFSAQHVHDPERMWRKGEMLYCFCGSAYNRHSFPKLAAEVFEAHERLATKAKFTLHKWELSAREKRYGHN